MVVVESSLSEEKLIDKLADKLQQLLGLNGECVNGTVINIALSGGSSAKIISNSFLKLKLSSHVINKCNFYFCDERYVPLTDNESNFKLLFDCLFEKIGVPSTHIFHINVNLDVDRCASEYSELINTNIMRKNSSGVPIFDLIVLGMGPDCHICSLFPKSPLLDGFDDQTNSKMWVAPVYKSPKPPPSRITLTIPILDACEKIFVIAYGPEKLNAIIKCFSDTINPSLPASILCRNEFSCNNDSLKRIYWFVDDAAENAIKSIIFNNKEI